MLLIVNVIRQVKASTQGITAKQYSWDVLPDYFSFRSYYNLNNITIVYGYANAEPRLYYYLEKLLKTKAKAQVYAGSDADVSLHGIICVYESIETNSISWNEISHAHIEPNFYAISI